MFPKRDRCRQHLSTMTSEEWVMPPQVSYWPAIMVLNMYKRDKGERLMYDHMIELATWNICKLTGKVIGLVVMMIRKIK